VTDLHKVIDLRTAIDLRDADGGPIDAGMRLDLNVVSNHHVPRLYDLVPMALVVLGKSKSIGADHDPILQDDVITDLAELPDHGVRVREKIVADRYPVVDDHVRHQCAVVS